MSKEKRKIISFVQSLGTESIRAISLWPVSYGVMKIDQGRITAYIESQSGRVAYYFGVLVIFKDLIFDIMMIYLMDLSMY